MAGYDGFSKSNNAIAAEENGLYPASVLARRLKVKTAAVRALLSPEEWHHTSKRYNRTDYYSTEGAVEILDELRAWTPKPPAKVYVCDMCHQRWLTPGACWDYEHSRPCGTRA